MFSFQHGKSAGLSRMNDHKSSVDTNTIAAEALDLIAGTQRGLTRRTAGSLWLNFLLATLVGAVVALESVGWFDAHLWGVIVVVGAAGLLAYLHFWRTGVRYPQKLTWSTGLFAVLFAVAFTQSIRLGKQVVATHGEVYAWHIGFAAGLALLLVLLGYRWYAGQVASPVKS